MFWVEIVLTGLLPCPPTDVGVGLAAGYPVAGPTMPTPAPAENTRACGDGAEATDASADSPGNDTAPLTLGPPGPSGPC